MTEVRGLAIYTLPKIDVQVSGTLQSRPGPEITAMWNVPASLIAQSLGRAPSGGVANVQTNILTAGELYGDRVTQVDMRIAKLLRFGRTAHQRRGRRLQPAQLERAADLRHHLRGDLAQPELGPRCALCEDQRAVRFLMRDAVVQGLTLALLFGVCGRAAGAGRRGDVPGELCVVPRHGRRSPARQRPERRGAAAVQPGGDSQLAAERQDADPGDAA